MTLPEQAKKETWEWYDPDSGESKQGFDTQQEAYDDRPNIGAVVSKVEAKDSPQNYRSNHWDQPNVLAHVRLNERTDADGKRVLFIEEVQSDWHQDGRKKGYTDETNLTGVPNAPLKKEWPMVVMKRMIRYAAENGFDKIAWTTGEQQAERYDLSKHAGGVYYTQDGVGKGTIIVMPVGRTIHDNVRPLLEKDNVAPEDLTGIVGKEVADKLMQSEPDNQGFRKIEGNGLKVGGELMQELPDVLVLTVYGGMPKNTGLTDYDKKMWLQIITPSRSNQATRKYRSLRTAKRAMR